MRHPDNRVHGRPDFVAHVREEHRLGLGCLLGLRFGHLKLFLGLPALDAKADPARREPERGEILRG